MLGAHSEFNNAFCAQQVCRNNHTPMAPWRMFQDQKGGQSFVSIVWCMNPLVVFGLGRRKNLADDSVFDATIVWVIRVKHVVGLWFHCSHPHFRRLNQQFCWSYWIGSILVIIKIWRLDTISKGGGPTLYLQQQTWPMPSTFASICHSEEPGLGPWVRNYPLAGARFFTHNAKPLPSLTLYNTWSVLEQFQSWCLAKDSLLSGPCMFGLFWT